IDHLPVHHTNEIAQSEGASGKPFAHYWMHTNHILVENEKIAKSLGNGITLEDIKKRGFSFEALRLLVLESHYRSQSKFSWDNLEAAENRLRDLQAAADLRHQPTTESMSEELDLFFKKTKEEIKDAMTDDLNTPRALAALSTFVDHIFSIPIPATDGKYSDGTLGFFDDIFGLKLSNRPDITDEQKSIIREREKVRHDKNWKKSDELRDELKQQGLGLRDTMFGPQWYRI
ncbi:MAG: CysS/YqeB C-terminal domain-containing protein, partial [Candidatus Saccharimonadales bacterium]